MKKNPLSLLWLASSGFLPLSLEAQYDTDLIGYWQFENDLVESSGSHTAGTHDGTAVGTIAYGAGPMASFGQGITLDGSNGVIVNGTNAGQVGYVNTFDDGVDGALSISFWAQGLPTRWSPFVAKRGETEEGYQVRRRDSTSNATFTLRGTDGVDDPQGAIDVATGQPVWTHYAATWNATTGERRLYINGVEDTVQTQTGDNAGDGPGNAINYWLTFGMRHNNADPAVFQNFFSGAIDDVAIWNRELSSQEAFQLGQAPLADILTETDSDGDGLFDSQESTFGTNPGLTDTDGDGVTDFEEFTKGGNGTVDDDIDMDGLTNLQETTGSANPFVSGLNTGTTPGETTDWNDPDSDGDGVNDGDELSASNGFVTDPNNSDTDGDSFSDATELAGGFDPTDPDSVPPITAGLVGYWEFEGDLTETSEAHPVGTHDAATTDGFAPEFGVGPTVADNGVSADFGGSLNTVAEGVSYGVYVKGSNSVAGTPEEPYVDTFDAAIGDEFSVSVWAKGWPDRWNPFVSKKGEANEGFQIRRADSTNNATFTLHQTAGAIDPRGTDTSGLGQPAWKHYLGTWNGQTGERKLYVDGVLAFTVTGDFETGDVGAADNYWLTFGARHNNADPAIFGNLFAGEIDDVAFWHRALTPVEAAQLSSAPLSFIKDQEDNDRDGLVAILEDEFGTSDDDPDSDDDGVSDLDEYNKGGNGNLDDDFDNDGLTNSQETSGTANPWVEGSSSGTPGEITDWCNPDSDGDGLSDGDEVAATNGSVTDPNNPDTDGDGFNDGTEVASATDPLNSESIPTNWLRDLCGYWQFDNDLTDSTAPSADGIMRGIDTTETYATGQFGQSIDLDKASEQRIEVTGDENNFDSVGGDLTVSLWIQVESFDQAWQAIISKGEGSNWRMARRDDSNGVSYAGGAADVPSTNELANAHPVNDGNWHHVVAVTTAGVSQSLWVDGVLVETRTDNLPSLTDSPHPLLIGGNPDTAADLAGAFRTWNGNIDDAAVWKRALSVNEVATLFYNGNSLEYLIANDVTPIEPPVIADVEITATDFDELGGFNVEVSGLAPNDSYQMRRSLLLDGTDWIDVGDVFSGGATHTFVDTEPVAKAFYQIFEVTPN
ncbi:LamG-like jellyroll fold domain-containing protein [Roseibacillus persicicus]|uniref:LamG domain-containing protein n=1 Tax=Roseibacillus persicicus TaxID=454148 RepID=UPI00398AE4E3